MSVKCLKNIREKNVGKVVIGYRNINSIRQKFDKLIQMTYS